MLYKKIKSSHSEDLDLKIQSSQGIFSLSFSHWGQGILPFSMQLLKGLYPHTGLLLVAATVDHGKINEYFVYSF